MLTQARADLITKYLEPDYEYAGKFLAMDPSEALTEINAHGYDFTLEEIVAYGEAFKAAAANVELGPDQLDEVAGGLGLVAAGLIIGGVFVVGVINGALGKK